MRNVAYLGLCWATTLGLVAAVLADQPPATGGQFAPQWAPQPRQNDAYQANGQSDRPGSSDRQPDAWPSDRANYDGQHALPAPQDRSIISGSYSPGQPAAGGQPRGELGVWLIESGGPGVAIQRITRGSAAEQAGLRSGDIILQVNGRGATSPQGAAQMIRQIPIGQSGTLTIWREGDQQQLQVTMQPAREFARDASRQLSDSSEQGSNSDWAARTVRLEQQINVLTQELHQLRQELAQLRTGSGAQPAVFNAESNQGQSPQSTTQQPQPAAAATPAPNQTPLPPGFGAVEEKPAKPAAEPAKTPAPPAEPAKAPTPGAEKPAANNPFGAEPAPAPAKGAEKPKADKGSKSDSNELF